MARSGIGRQATVARPAAGPRAVARAYRKPWTVERVLAQAALVVLVLVVLLPFLFMVRVSLASPQAYLSGIQVWLSPIIVDNFSDVFTSTNFLYYLVNSLIVSVLTTIMVLVIGSMAGFGLAKMSAGFRDNIMFFVLSTRMGPTVVFALPFFLLMTSAGLVDTYPGLLVIYVFANLAFAIWLTYGFFRDVPVDVEQAAMLDGLNPVGVFRHISLPMVAPGLIAAAIFVFIFTWNEFFYALVLTRDVAKTFPPMIPAFFGAFRVDWGQMLAASVTGILPPLVFGLLIRRYLIRGLTLGQVK